MLTSTPFPFLSLPKELRLIVYSFVSPATKHLPILLPPPSTDSDSLDQDCTPDFTNQHCLTLVHITHPFLPLLLTSHQIHYESHSILRAKAALLSTLPVPPIRIIATPSGLSHDRLLGILICTALTPTNCPYSHFPHTLATTFDPHEHSSLPICKSTPKRQVDIAIVQPSKRTDGMKGSKEALERDMLDLGFDLKYCGVERGKLKVDVRVRCAGLNGEGEREMFGEVEARRTVERGMCWFVRGGKAITGKEWEGDWREG